MLQYPAIDPVAFYIFSWPVYWYGLMYLVGIIAGWILLAWRARNPARGFTQEQVSDVIFYTVLGVIIGGRLGYMIFYDWRVLLAEPLMLFKIWKGGMSFHGGLIGVILALWIYAIRYKKHLFDITDFIAPVVPIGLGAGRIGNFINGELWGRVTTLPWGMVFPNGGDLPRHPSQLYESFLEGLILFLILWIYSGKIRPRGAVSGLFLIFYGLFRFTIEFFRQPDLQIGFIGGFTEGQLLSLPMIIFGGILFGWAMGQKNRKQSSGQTEDKT